MPTCRFDVFDGEKALIDDVGDAFPVVEDTADHAAGLLAAFAVEVLPRRPDLP